MSAVPTEHVAIWHVPIVQDHVETPQAMGFCEEHAGVGFISSIWLLQLLSLLSQISGCDPGVTVALQVDEPPEQTVVPVEQMPEKPVMHGWLLTRMGSSIVPLQSSSLPLHISCTVPGSGVLQVS